MKVKPLGKRVLLKPSREEEKTKGGIYIPESAKEEKKEGEVIELGNDLKDVPLKVGDKVLYGGYSSEEVEIDGEKHVIIDFKDIIAKLEE
ncbi:co-chaperone GroES [Candidatus Woesearchaeota archaeon]|nr:MAG: co-chaperone GroES [Candidatus Woesearchaeota archaeon]